MGEVLSTERVIDVRREYEQRADGWAREISLMALSHEELRARLERAERERDEAREALRAMTTCYVTSREAQGWPGVEDLPAVKMARAALGAAGERGTE